MNKKLILRILVATVVLAAAVMWFLSLIPATQSYFNWFSFAWAVTMVVGAMAVRYLLSGLFMRADQVVLKKSSFLIAGVFGVATVFCLVWAIALPQEWIAPLIAIIVAGVVFLGILFTAGNKWDSGDNEKVGYKNYHQRKAEEAKHKKDQE